MTVEKLVRSLGLVTVAAFVLSLAAALFTPTPMLLTPDLSHEDRLWPVYQPETRPAKLGELLVTPDDAYGCVVLKTAAGQRVTSLCHHNLRCVDASKPVASATGFEIFQPAGRGPYYIAVSSRCDSGCCDERSTRLSMQGERLDDTLWDRVWNRLSYPGAAALIVAIGSTSRLRRNADQPGKLVRLWAVLIAACGLAIACLWRTM